MNTSASSKSELKLFDRLRQALRSRHYSKRTDKTYVVWVKRFIYCHNVKHPAKMSGPEIKDQHKSFTLEYILC